MSDGISTTPLRRVLVANRGEIALRVIRACRELGIETIAIFAAPDAQSMHVRSADRSVCIGPREASLSYLNSAAIITAAQALGVDAIHPGYGFLAENADFAAACLESGLIWIGPSPQAIRTMGDKAAAREAMRAAGVPIVPGSGGPVDNIVEAKKVAAEIGFPVLIKAAAGGGGKGMRAVERPDDLEGALELARAEAELSFGSPSVYIEKLLKKVRHVEIQVLGDTFGSVVHLWERDCSAQRRRQKLIEEAPAPNLAPAVRKDMTAAAVAAASAVDYTGAGTVEFIYDSDSSVFYFMEMNTRIQVEHPVTEMVTSIDLVQEQLRIAAGLPLRYSQEDIRCVGHAVECRINAEDSITFLPSTGVLSAYEPPGGPGVRIDSHCYPGYSVPPFWDSLLSKVIVWAPTRTEAIARMKRALHEYRIDGVSTTIPLQLQLLDSVEFSSGAMFTDSVEALMNVGI